ncbi:MAG: 16S rRNA (guanine(527)-N(7))-methyltransferase RsmG, partial [Phycisphaerales bacterium]
CALPISGGYRRLRNDPPQAGTAVTDTLAPIEPTPEFLAAAEEYGIAFEPGDLERLGRYLALLLDANTRMNLTAIRDPGEAWLRHIFDSLTLLPMLAELPAGARVADVGSGGGAPGIPLAIVLPDLRFTLIEATGKKADFLRAAADSIGLANLEVVADRAESVGQSALRAQFDAVTARAVGPIRVLAELVIPLATVGGLALLIKGQKAEEELADAKRALHSLHATVAGVVPTPTGRIVALEKPRATPGKYPRRPGEPKREPL